ncbi:BTAD domain-containing putative transcriptional regulator [Catenulispora yoronensis]
MTVRDPAGTRIPVGPPMQQALLGCLLAAVNRQISRERLIGDLWGPTPPPSARAALNNQISSLRRTLQAQGSARLRTVAGGYLLEAPDTEVDFLVLEQRLLAAHAARDRGDWARVAEQTAAALELWRGTPLDGLPNLAECDWYAPFLARCDGLRMQALEGSVEAEFRLGRYQALTSRLVALVGEFPLNEAFHAYLMRCLAMAGRRADALEVYQRLRRTLVDELGIEPGEPTRTVQARILSELPEQDELGGGSVADLGDGAGGRVTTVSHPPRRPDPAPMGPTAPAAPTAPRVRPARPARPSSLSPRPVPAPLPRTTTTPVRALIPLPVPATATPPGTRRQTSSPPPRSPRTTPTSPAATTN